MKEKKLNQLEKSNDEENNQVFADQIKNMSNDRIALKKSNSTLTRPTVELVKENENKSASNWSQYGEPFLATSRFPNHLPSYVNFTSEAKIATDFDRKTNMTSFYDQQKSCIAETMTNSMVHCATAFDQIGTTRAGVEPLITPLPNLTGDIPPQHHDKSSEICDRSPFKPFYNFQFTHEESINPRDITLNSSQAPVSVAAWQGASVRSHENNQETLAIKSNLQFAKVPHGHSWKGNDVYQKQKAPRANTCEAHFYNQPSLDYNTRGGDHVFELSQIPIDHNHVIDQDYIRQYTFDLQARCESTPGFLDSLGRDKDTKMRHSTFS